MGGRSTLRRRLRKVITLATHADRKALEAVEREFARPDPGGFRKTFLQPLRNDWAFHYCDSVYREALRAAGPQAEVLIGGSRGLSCYLVVDDFIANGMVGLAGARRRPTTLGSGWRCG
jgi:hypothetical protein